MTKKDKIRQTKDEKKDESSLRELLTELGDQEFIVTIPVSEEGDTADERKETI